MMAAMRCSQNASTSRRAEEAMELASFVEAPAMVENCTIDELSDAIAHNDGTLQSMENLSVADHVCKVRSFYAGKYVRNSTAYSSA